MCTLDSVVVYSFIFSVFLHQCCWKDIYCKQFLNISSKYQYVAINCSLVWKSIWRNKNALKLSPWFSQYFLLLWMHFGSTIVIENNSPHWKIKSFYMYIKGRMCWSIVNKLPTALVKLKVQYMCICLWWAICLLKN